MSHEHDSSYKYLFSAPELVGDLILGFVPDEWLLETQKYLNYLDNYRGPGIRIYLIQDGDLLVVLLGGGTKNGQTSDIKLAKRLRDEYALRQSKLKKNRKG